MSSARVQSSTPCPMSATGGVNVSTQPVAVAQPATATQGAPPAQDATESIAQPIQHVQEPTLPASNECSRRKLRYLVREWRTVLLIMTFILAIASFVAPIPFSASGIRKADEANKKSREANDLSKISVAYDDQDYCEKHNLEHTPRCLEANKIIFGHLGIGYEQDSRLERSISVDLSQQQNSYSVRDARDFAWNSSHWIQCQLMSFQDFSADFKLTFRSIFIRTLSRSQYAFHAGEFTMQADIAIDRLRLKEARLQSYLETRPALDPAVIVQYSLQTLGDVLSSFSKLISEAAQAVSIATDSFQDQRPECKSQPSCRLSPASFLPCAKPDMRAQYDILRCFFHGLKNNITATCPEQCLIGRGNFQYLLSEFASKTRSLLNKQPHLEQIPTGPPMGRRLWDTSLAQLEITLALLIGASLSIATHASYKSLVLGVILSTPLLTVLHRYVYMVDPITARSWRFVSTAIELLLPGIVSWITTANHDGRRTVKLNRYLIDMRFLTHVVLILYCLLAAWLSKSLIDRAVPRFQPVEPTSILKPMIAYLTLHLVVAPLKQFEQRSLCWRLGEAVARIHPIHDPLLASMLMVAFGLPFLVFSKPGLLLLVAFQYALFLHIARGPTRNPRVNFLGTMCYMWLVMVFNMAYYESAL